jgi:zinc transporter
LSFADEVRERRNPAIAVQADSLFAVINDVVFNFAFETSDVATLWVSVRPWLVLTARRSPLRAIDRLRTEVKQGHTLESPLALVEHLFRHQADELQRIARAATDRVDDIEDEVLAGHLMAHSAELARLRRMSVRLQRLLVPEPSAMLRLLANPPAWVPPRDVQRLQQVYDEFALVVRDIGSLQERIKLLQDESSARVAEENNRSLFVLTMVTVLALPINLTSGLMGMNVGGVPLGQDPHGFWWMFLLIGAITVAMAWLAVRWWRKSKRRP